MGGRDDPAFGIAVSGFPAGELGHDDVLDAGGIDREGEAPGDVLDQILIGVELELVVARGIPGVPTDGEAFMPNTVRGPKASLGPAKQ